MDQCDEVAGDQNELNINQSIAVNEIGLGEFSVGKYFESMEEAQQSYKDYGIQHGFTVRTRVTTKGIPRSDEITGMTFVCSREGTHTKLQEKKREYDVAQETLIDNSSGSKSVTSKRTTSTVKCDCKARLRVALDRCTMKWKITQFIKQHNHKLVTPSKRKKMRPLREMPKAAKDLTEVFRREQLPIAKVPDIFGGEDVGFDRRDCWNHLAKVRQRDYNVGDTVAMLNYFRKKQAESPQFYYAIQLDEEGRAANFFWVDARSRSAYSCFGDVVTFDTTYRTNKYDMPFAPFTGVNHHYQTIQFGCALLCDETEQTFVWLFNTWLEAMGNSPPVSIITDQDLAMKGAIAKVFPTTRHRLCIWHIKKKFAEKLSHVYFEKSQFKKKMKRCIHWTYTEHEFEEMWQTLMVEYQLEDNDWLTQLFAIRESWVPVFNRTTFFAGMNTTGRSEGVNAFFDAFVTPRTTLREFVESYDRALKKLVVNETNEDFESEHKERIVERGNLLLRHAATVYTRNIYKKLVNEWEEVWKFKVDREEWEQDWRVFHVKTKEEVDGYKQQFCVRLNPATHFGTCSCKMWEFSGLICRHIMKVFQRIDVDKIPTPFILVRWSKGANKFRVMDPNQMFTGIEGDCEEVDALCLNRMCQEMTRLAWRSFSFKEGYLAFMEGAKYTSDLVEAAINQAMLLRAAKRDNSKVGSHEPDPLATHLSTPTNLTELFIQDPNVSQTKGRKKDAKGKEKVQAPGRIKSGLELASIRKKRLCGSCHKYRRHDKRNCPKNPNNRNKGTMKNDSSTEDDDDADQWMEDDP